MKFEKQLKNLFPVVLIAILFWILQNAILNYDVIIYQFNPLVLIFGIIVYLMLLIFMSKKIIPKIEKMKYIHICFFCIFIILAIVIGQVFKLNPTWNNGEIFDPTWDMGEVFSIAKNYTLGCDEIRAGYLLRCPNNQMITIIYIALFKFIYVIFKIDDFITVVTLFNSLVISATVILLYYSIEKIYNKSKALQALIICLFTTPLYLYCSVYYSDSLSMFFTILILYLFLILKGSNNKKKKNLLLIFMGIILAISWKVKITGVFIGIAIVVYQFLSKLNKQILKSYLCIGLVSILVLLSFSFIMSKQLYQNGNLDVNKIPIVHWIMMGLVDNGNYNKELFDYTISYDSYDEKKEADIMKIKEILKNYSCNDFIKHLTVKLKFAWNDGTYYAPVKLEKNPVNKNLAHEFILNNGKYVIFYKYFPQIMHLSLLFLIVCSCIKLIKDKDYLSTKYILVICLVGIILFLLIWENRSRYVLTVFPICLALAVDGIDLVNDFIISRAKKLFRILKT